MQDLGLTYHYSWVPRVLDSHRHHHRYPDDIGRRYSSFHLMDAIQTAGRLVSNCIQRSMSEAIDIYQRTLSPHKGFCCTYRIVFGVPSCSQQAKNYVRRGSAAAVSFIVYRLFRCLCVRAFVGFLWLRTRNLALCHRYIRRRFRRVVIAENTSDP